MTIAQILTEVDQSWRKWQRTSIICPGTSQQLTHNYKRLKEADSDLYDFEDEYEASHFQMADTNFDKSEF